MCDGVRTELITFICFITALNTNEAFAATAGRLPVIGAVSRVLTFRNYDTADEEKEIHMEIPQIQEPEAGSTSSPLAADVNKEIEKSWRHTDVTHSRGLKNIKRRFWQQEERKKHLPKKESKWMQDTK